MNFLRLQPRAIPPTTSHLFQVHPYFRSVATAAIISSTGGYTISEVVSEDHRELEAYSHKMLGSIIRRLKTTSSKYFQRLYPDSYEFGPKLRELMEGLRKYIMEMEDNELPRLEKALKERELEKGKNAGIELARSFRRTQLFIPTRAHP
ncbi:hypothetical protein BDD12DRAFT_927947 [Trichophaea hybrida]|nr:hypothetical protein BDD12DRAFT_927947 [Trichophaea hybrida]